MEPETLVLLSASYDLAIEILTHTGEIRDRPKAARSISEELVNHSVIVSYGWFLMRLSIK